MSARPEPPMMGCGHAANATTTEGAHVCAICFGIHPGAAEVVTRPDLSGREAECTYCGRRKPSHPSLAFFGYRADATVDGFYDGCRGWD